MSADREQDHLDMMSNMVDRHHNQPAAYFDAYELEPEDVVLDRLHLELKASWEALRHTNAGEVTRG